MCKVFVELGPVVSQMGLGRDGVTLLHVKLQTSAPGLILELATSDEMLMFEAWHVVP